MPPLLGKARVIDDPGFDPPATLDRRQHELAHPGQHRSVRPWCIAHKMQQGLMLRGDLRGKQDNCQVAVSLSLANHDASLPIAYRLYLPEDWAKDQARRDKARMPATIAFQTKPEIAFEQIKAARAAGLPEGVVLMDAGYGNDTGLRTDITALDLRYVAGIGPTTSVWPPGEA